MNAMLMTAIWGGLALTIVSRAQTCSMEHWEEGEVDEGRNLPVFLVCEVALPDYTPGLSLSIKCAM